MCTSFAVYSQNNPIYGMNYDPSEDIDLKLNIYDYADSNVFYFSALMDHIYRDIAGMNSKGLFLCTQAQEYSPNFQPCSHENHVLVFDVIEKSLRVGEKVSDFLDILNDRHAFYTTNPQFPNMGLHTIIADKYGDAVILEEGINTNVISKIDGKSIVMTNFPNGNFENQKFDEVYGCGADRYIKAYKNINDKMNNFGINDAFDVLRKTSQDTTTCSIVFEPLKLEAYICFKIDFDKKWKVSIKEKTIQSLNGFNNNTPIIFTTEGVSVKQLYKFYE